MISILPDGMGTLTQLKDWIKETKPKKIGITIDNTITIIEELSYHFNRNHWDYFEGIPLVYLNNDIICIYCNKPWSHEMLNTLKFADCSYTPDCVNAEFRNSIDINCCHCKRLIYKKELQDIAEAYTTKQWAQY